jgi:hypothetical protein
MKLGLAFWQTVSRDQVRRSCLCLFNDVATCSDYMGSRMIRWLMNSELDTVWKEAVMAWFKAQPRNGCGKVAEIIMERKWETEKEGSRQRRVSG